MNIVPWKKSEGRKPFGELQNLHQELDRLFDGSFFRWPEWSLDTAEKSWTPAIDVSETKNEFKVRADVPGLERKDIQVSVDGDILTIKGEKKDEDETNEDGWVRRERTYGSFFRSFSLPQTVDAANVKANYKNGVLELTIPKREEAKPKQIDVKVE